MGTLLWTGIIYFCTIGIVMVTFRCFREDQKEFQKVLLIGAIAANAAPPKAGAPTVMDPTPIRDKTGLSPLIKRASQY